MALAILGAAAIAASARADDCGDGDGAGGSYACGVIAETHGNSSNSGFGNSVFIGGGTGNTAVGSSAQVGVGGSSNNTAVGWNANTGSANNATAVGYGATAEDGSTSLGKGAQANFTNSMALGQDVKSSADNQVAIGAATNTYTLAGLDSTASRTAQSGPIHLVTTDADGNMASATFDVATLEDLSTTVQQNSTDISNLQTTVVTHASALLQHTAELQQHSTDILSLQTTVGSHTTELQIHEIELANHENRITTNTNDIAVLDNRVDTLEANFQNLGDEISDTRSEARSGTALALATAGLRYDDRPEKLSMAGGFGYFKGKSGFALGLGYNPSVDVRLNAALSASPGQGNVGVSVGASWTLN